MTNHDIARTILDDARYVVLATADADGTPWASPVWFAHQTYHRLFWVSDPAARHSHNIAARPQIAMVVFDSTASPLTGQGVYMTATAEQITDPGDLEQGIEVFSTASVRQGLSAFGLDRVTGPARLRLYRAEVTSHSILDPDSPFDVRIDVAP